MSLAVIPARGGSKRIPGKNIKIFAGQPMIAYAITAALESGLFKHVIVTTDDAEIAAIAREWKAQTPFLRPPELAVDCTPTLPVVAHAINACKELKWEFNLVCCIYPCVPFIQIDDLRNTARVMRENEINFCFPVTEFASAVQRAMRRLPNGKMGLLYPKYELTRTQDLEPTYHDVGQFYWGRADSWLTNERILGNSIGMPIPSWRVVDIDTPEDWERAEIFHKFMHGNCVEK